jgi:gentisate 1,2-dioxygenase
MSTSPLDLGSPVRLRATAAAGQPDVTPELEELYRGFEKELLVPLWTEIGDLMPVHPRSRAVPHLWRWEMPDGMFSSAISFRKTGNWPPREGCQRRVRL